MDDQRTNREGGVVHARFGWMAIIAVAVLAYGIGYGLGFVNGKDVMHKIQLRQLKEMQKEN